MGGPTELVLERADGSQRSIHPLWLRERCKDPASIDLQTQQRLQDPSDFDLDLKLVAVSQPSAGTYKVKFSDGHEASFSGAGAVTADMRSPGNFGAGFSAGPSGYLVARRRRLKRKLVMTPICAAHGCMAVSPAGTGAAAGN